MEMDTIGDQDMDQIPKYGLKLALNHEYPLQSKQIIVPTAKQMFDMMPLTTRYLKYYVGRRMNKKKPIMDYIHMISAQRMYGCPIGGIGGGTIGRGYKGEFCRFQLYPGMYDHITVPECQFIVNIQDSSNETIFQSVLSTYNKPKKAPSSWEWNLNGAECQYTALYPRAWTTYNLSKYGVKLVCRQISPVIPHNYKDSSLPCAVFVFTATNTSNEHREVSITQTWTEIALRANKKKKHLAKLELERYSEEHTCGVSLEQKVGDTSCTFTVAKKKDEKETIHEGYCLWNASKTSSYVWECLKKHGKLGPDPSLTPPPPKVPDKSEEKQHNKKEKTKKIHKCDSIGLSSVISLDPGGSGTTEFCLAWDMPIIKYKKDKKIHRRYYTKYFGSDGIAGASIAAYALRNYKNWEKQLAEWQDPILNNNNIPDWLKSALMNELYYIADGGTIWFDVAEEFPKGDPRHDFGLFGYLEGHEYRMYNTYDVHFYASFALAQLWPNLQVVLQYMFRDTISLETEKCRKSLYNGKNVKFKIKDSIPHDLGDPEDVPFSNINAYNIHDVSEWRDLNLKFVLQVARDYRLLRAYSAPFNNDRYRSMAYIDDVRSGTEDDLYARSTGQAGAGEPEPARAPAPPPARPRDILDLLYRSVEERGEECEEEDAREEAGVWDARQYVTDMYPACAALVRRALQAWDTDGDGLIENGGFPDQTYDAWVMSGPRYLTILGLFKKGVKRFLRPRTRRQRAAVLLASLATPLPAVAQDSAYCGGLWVAAVSGVVSMARALNLDEDVAEFSALLERAKAAYEEKLWNGSFYRFDTKPANERVVMSDQLAGQWFLRASGSTEKVFPEAHVRLALSSIYSYNVCGFMGGKMGAVNGFMADRGRVDTTALQSGEVWVGVTYGLAALMIYEGMHEEAFKTAGGLCNTLTQMGLSFETPEALYENGNHRSIAYMRPLAIWGMYQAVIARPPIHTPVANGQVVKDNHVNGL